jgi:hypothetical protein
MSSTHSMKGAYPLNVPHPTRPWCVIGLFMREDLFGGYRMLQDFDRTPDGQIRRQRTKQAAQRRAENLNRRES